MLNTAAWQGEAPLPLDPLGFRAGVGAAEGWRPPPEPRPHSRQPAGVGGRAASAHVKSGCMCAAPSFGRARLRLRMPLYGFRLHHGLRGGCAAPEPEAGTGATHLLRCLVWHRRRLGCALHPNLPGGSLRPSSPYGKVVEPDGTGDHVRDTRTETDIARGCSRGPARGPGCRDGDPARRPAWSRTGATAPAPVAASADAGSLCVPIGSQSRREHKGCLQNRGRGFAASRGPAEALAAEGAIMALVQRRSRARHAADDPGLAGLGRGLDPGGGTGGVRPGGRGDRRRSGGNADRAVAGHDADSPAKSTASTGDDRGAAGEHPATGRVDGRPGGSRADSPNRERCRSGGFEGGRSTPRQSANVLHRVGWLAHLSGIRQALRRPIRRSS